MLQFHAMSWKLIRLRCTLATMLVNIGPTVTSWFETARCHVSFDVVSLSSWLSAWRNVTSTLDVITCACPSTSVSKHAFRPFGLVKLKMGLKHNRSVLYCFVFTKVQALKSPKERKWFYRSAILIASSHGLLKTGMFASTSRTGSLLLFRYVNESNLIIWLSYYGGTLIVSIIVSIA